MFREAGWSVALRESKLPDTAQHRFKHGIVVLALCVESQGLAERLVKELSAFLKQESFVSEFYDVGGPKDVVRVYIYPAPPVGDCMLARCHAALFVNFLNVSGSALNSSVSVSENRRGFLRSENRNDISSRYVERCFALT